MREPVLLSSPRGVGPAAFSPREDFATSVNRHLIALGAGEIDLRILRSGQSPTTFRNLSYQGLQQILPELAMWEKEGANLLVRPSHPSNLQLLTRVPNDDVASAIQKGFEATAVVERGPDLCDVWIRHASGASFIPPELSLYMRRAVCLEYGVDLNHSAQFGLLATPPEALRSDSGCTYSRAQDLQHWFGVHVAKHREDLHTACRAVGIPTLGEYRAAHWNLSSRHADAQWCGLALKAGLHPEQTFTALVVEGCRHQALRPDGAVRYAARNLREGLALTQGLTGSALNAATLKSVAGALSLTINVLRITGVVVDLVTGLARGGASR